MLQHFAALNLRQAFSQPRAQNHSSYPTSRSTASFTSDCASRPCCAAMLSSFASSSGVKFHFHAVSVFHFANKVYTVAAPVRAVQGVQASLS